MRIFAAVLCCALVSGFARAEWRPEFASAPQDVQDWYRNAELTQAAQKRFSFKKCCDHTEVIRARFRVNPAGDDQWQYQKPDGTWAEIPPDIIHFGESGPRGEAVLFQLPSTGALTCFFPPQAGG